MTEQDIAAALEKLTNDFCSQGPAGAAINERRLTMVKALIGELATCMAPFSDQNIENTCTVIKILTKARRAEFTAWRAANPQPTATKH